METTLSAVPVEDAVRFEMQVAAFRDHVWRSAVDKAPTADVGLNLDSRMVRIYETVTPDEAEDIEEEGAPYFFLFLSFFLSSFS